MCVTSYHGASESFAISVLFFHYRGLMEIYMDIEVGWGLKPQGLRQSGSWLWLKEREIERGGGGEGGGAGGLRARWSLTWWKKYKTWKLSAQIIYLPLLISPSLSSDMLHLHCQLKSSLSPHVTQRQLADHVCGTWCEKENPNCMNSN